MKDVYKNYICVSNYYITHLGEKVTLDDLEVGELFELTQGEISGCYYNRDRSRTFTNRRVKLTLREITLAYYREMKIDKLLEN